MVSMAMERICLPSRLAAFAMSKAELEISMVVFASSWPILLHS